MALTFVKDRVIIRKPELEESPVLLELVKTASDRINIRVGETELPVELETVAVEVVCALHNRMYYEGIKSENADTFSVSFVDDVLREYETDLQRYREKKAKDDIEYRGGVVNFL